MRVAIVSDQSSVAGAIRQMLLQQRHECPSTNMMALSQAARLLPAVRAELIVLILPPDMEKALEQLADIRAACQCRVVVVGPATDSKLVLRALRAGADDYVDETSVESELASALGRCKAEAPAGGETGQIIGVLSSNGGCGSSTLAANVATVLAKERKKSCVLLDFKPGVGDLSALLDLKPAYTLADLCQNVTRMDRLMFERSLVRHDSGVHLLAPPRSLADLKRISPQAVRQALTMAKTLFPWVIIDLDDCVHEEQVLALRQADLVLVIFRLEFTSLRNARRTLEQLKELEIPNDRIQLVANRYGQPNELPASKAQDALGMKITYYIPDDPKAVNLANNNGVPVVLEVPSAKVSRSIAQLATGIDGHRSK